MEVWRADIITVADDLRELMQQFGIESMAPVDSRADEGALPAMFGVRAPALSRIAMVGGLTRERNGGCIAPSGPREGRTTMSRPPRRRPGQRMGLPAG